MMSTSSFAAAAIYLLASIKPSSAQSPTPTSGAFGPCPATVGVQNGDFESGEIAPWTSISQSSTPTQLAGEIISSGGQQGNRAFQVKFPPAKSITWYLGQDMGQQCEGAEYTVSFAVNWIGFAPHGDAGVCTIGVEPSYCNDANSEPGYYNASTQAGWMQYSYTCKSRKTAWANLNINVGCSASETLPAFTMQLDSFGVGLAKDQTAPLTSGSTAVATGTAPVGNMTVAPTGSSSGVSSGSSTSGAAGRARRKDFFTSLEGLCLLLGPSIHQLLAAV